MFTKGLCKHENALWRHTITGNTINQSPSCCPLMHTIAPALVHTYHELFPASDWERQGYSVQFSCSVVSDSVTLWTAAHQASLSITNSRSVLKLMSITLVMPTNHLILCCSLLLPPSILARIRVFFFFFWVMITLYAGQKKRHRCIEQTFGLCRRRRGWDDLRE